MLGNNLWAWKEGSGVKSSSRGLVPNTHAGSQVIACNSGSRGSDLFRSPLSPIYTVHIWTRMSTHVKIQSDKEIEFIYLFLRNLAIRRLRFFGTRMYFYDTFSFVTAISYACSCCLGCFWGGVIYHSLLCCVMSISCELMGF